MLASYSGGFGLKTNDKEIRKFIDRTISKYVYDLKKQCLPIVKELREEALIAWFSDIGFGSSYKTMFQALDYDVEVHQNSGFISIDFISYVNPSLYEITHTSLYKQRNKYTVDPFEFIVGELQWSQGILGLPEKSSMGPWVNSFFHQHSKSLEAYTKDKFKNNWKKRLHKHKINVK